VRNLLSEGAIAASVARHLSEKNNWQVWIHPHSSASSYREVSSQFPSHSITINGYLPDLLALDPQGMVNAIEVKDGKSVREGVGQAVTYKRGANYVFLAAPSNAVSLLKEDILAHGIGVIEVTNDLECFINRPPFTSSPIFLKDILRELTLLQYGESDVGRMTSLDLNHPINYISPVLFFDEEECSLLSVTNNIIQWGMGRPEKNLRGARLLGLVKKSDDVLVLTSDGNNLKRLLNRIYGKPLERLNELKGKGTLVDHDPELAYLIKLFYLKNPDVNTYVNILKSVESKKPTIFDILETAFKESPNLIVNFMVKRTRKNQVLSMLQKKSRNEMLDVLRTRNFVIRNLLKSLFFPFKRQLIHIGILKPSKIWSGGMETVDFSKDYWILK